MNKSKFFIATIALLICLGTSLLAQDRILIVVTNNKEVKATIAGKDTVIAGGYELSEVANAHRIFIESGFKVDFMSPKGGMTYAEPEEKIKEENKAFLANEENRKKLTKTFAPEDVDAEDYVAIYFAGGKTMWDFPENKELAKLTAKIYESNGIVGAVCHGPAALVNVKLSDGSHLIEGKKVSSFTNMEEKLFSKTAKFLPFMLQDKLKEMGGEFEEAPAMFDQVVVDQRLVTGQNPNSTHSVAEEMVKQLGVKPPSRNWSNMSYTLAVVKAVVLENSKKAKRFQKAHAATNQLEEQLFTEYSIYAYHGYLGDIAKDRGLALLEFSVEAFPENAKVHEELAKAYHKEGRTAEAISLIDKSLALNPDAETAQNFKKKIEQK